MVDRVRDIFLFSDLDETTLEKIKEFTFFEKLNKENILFYEGDESDYLYILTKGIIKLYKTASNNKEIILKYFQAGELIAEAASFQQIAYPATAEAFTPIEVLKIDFLKLKEIILTSPELCFKMNISLLKKIKNLENIISTHLVLDTKEKVAKYIYENDENFFSTKNVHIAQILNMTPETLSRTLKRFKDEHLIDIKNKKINKEALKAYFE
ncbi:MAG: Crp/Fnr family transcriptional regulator [Candidatus Marinarcus sp.]|uniref:Crp/Fnr family transcriptional regulator n=1 Tax=Candidatus Marinarcus sp. TaxID=3100987 RepID=UPI003AFFC361